jgi:hypothetical protein
MRLAIPLLLVAVALSACRSPRVTYGLAEKQFGELVKFTNDQIESGNLPVERAKKLAPAINGGNAALKNWLEAILATPEGEKPDVSAAIINTVLDALDILEVYFLQETKGGG